MLETVHLVTRVFPEVKKVKLFRKVAIVDNGTSRRQFGFFETVARNRGYNLMLFDDVRKAGWWLQKD